MNNKNLQDIPETYYKKNKEKILRQLKKKYREDEAFRKKRIEYSRRYRQNNPDKCKQIFASWYQRHKNEYNKKRRKNKNKEKT